MTTSPADKLILDLTALNPRSKSTLYQYRLVSTRFLSHASTPPTREDVLRFIGEKEAQATKSFVFFILRRLFTANRWEWPFPARAAPMVREQLQVKIPVGDVEKMVRSTELDPQESLYLALGTTYGFRWAELTSITRGCYDGDTLIVPTVKGGAVRRHTVPEDLVQYLEALPDTPATKGQVRLIFQSIAENSDVFLPKRAGWHAIRRTLISELSLKVPGVALVKFFGWRSGPGNRTFYTYANPDFRDVDKLVYEHHPFLGFWENNGR